MVALEAPTSAVLDGWVWAAQDISGQLFHEHTEDGTARGWSEVDHARVVAVHLFPRYDGLQHHAVWIDRARGEVPVFFRRRRIDIAQADGTETGRATIHVLGVERPDGSGAYVALYEDGSTVHTTNREAI